MVNIYLIYWISDWKIYELTETRTAMFYQIILVGKHFMF